MKRFAVAALLAAVLLSVLAADAQAAFGRRIVAARNFRRGVAVGVHHRGVVVHGNVGIRHHR